MDPEASVEACIRERYVELVRAVALTTRSIPVAEDAVAEAFARAWARARRGGEFDHLAGWVVTVALNLTRSRWRRVRREQALTHDPMARDRDHDTVLDVRAAVATLPRRQREVVVLHYLLDLDVAMTASTLGVSEGTVKTALSRARRALAPRLAVEEVE